MNARRRIAVIAGSAALAFAGVAVSAEASTFVVTDSSTFFADTTGQSTVGFGGIVPPGPGSYAFFIPALTVGGITFTTLSPAAGSSVNVDLPDYYFPVVYPTDFLTNSYQQENPYNTLSITLPSSVTAFGLNIGTYGGNNIAFTLSNGFAVDASSVGFGSMAFIGFISTDAFNTITLTPDNVDGWTLGPVTTGVSAVPLPAALPLFGAAVIGFAALGRRRRAPKTAA